MRLMVIHKLPPGITAKDLAEFAKTTQNDPESGDTILVYG